MLPGDPGVVHELGVNVLSTTFCFPLFQIRIIDLRQQKIKITVKILSASHSLFKNDFH